MSTMTHYFYCAVLCLAIVSAITVDPPGNNLVDVSDPSVQNLACPVNFWSPKNLGNRCPNVMWNNNINRRFRFFERTNACLIWHQGTRSWQGAPDKCKELQIDGGLELNVRARLAIPTNSNERSDWGFKKKNYWAGAIRPSDADDGISR